ncbi:Transposase [Desulfatibacillum aliphaticivorans]|uniref:Transposase n=1 Tax=Desulfatibacillum aliphaticivorans TaxID=218208 RepID=B8FFX2_DESAL|nr:IS110 family transposase [Desulfatibacillum aliphaticivorans]ACL03527.1 Transposase [Desulfatibacillum aliphaticivorans]
MNRKKTNRIEAFRQLKTEIRNSQRHLIVGIDIAKDRHHAFFGTAYGKTIHRRLVFENTSQGFDNLLAVTETHLKSNGLDIPVFALEPTGNYHKPLGEFLIRRGFHVALTSGVAVNRNRELLDGRWDKNDTKDAANVADLVSQGKFLFYDYPCPEVRELQDLTSLKIKLKKLEHGLKVRIRNHLAAVYFPELDRYCVQNSALSMNIVRKMLDPREIAGMDFHEFCQLATDRDRGLKQQQRLEAIYEAAHRSVGCVLDFRGRP